jgi:hypothetical protein
MDFVRKWRRAKRGDGVAVRAARARVTHKETRPLDGAHTDGSAHASARGEVAARRARYPQSSDLRPAPRAAMPHELRVRDRRRRGRSGAARRGRVFVGRRGREREKDEHREGREEHAPPAPRGLLIWRRRRRVGHGGRARRQCSCRVDRVRAAARAWRPPSVRLGVVRRRALTAARTGYGSLEVDSPLRDVVEGKCGPENTTKNPGAGGRGGGRDVGRPRKGSEAGGGV